MRSASTWSYNVCRALTAQTLIAGREAITSTYAGDTDAMLARLLAEQKNQNLRLRCVMKAHVLGPKTRRAIANGRVANVFTIRYPRDAMSSMLLFGQEKGEEERAELIRLFEGVLAQGLAFLQDSRSLVVRYEDMVADPAAQIRTIAAYMGRSVPEETIAEVDRATGTERVQRIVARLEAEAEPGQDHFDPATQLHIDHLHGGEVGRWRHELTPAFKARLQDAFGPYIAAYGYGEDDAGETVREG